MRKKSKEGNLDDFEGINESLSPLDRGLDVLELSVEERVEDEVDEFEVE